MRRIARITAFSAIKPARILRTLQIVSSAREVDKTTQVDPAIVSLAITQASPTQMVGVIRLLATPRMWRSAIFNPPPLSAQGQLFLPATQSCWAEVLLTTSLSVTV